MEGWIEHLLDIISLGNSLKVSHDNNDIKEGFCALETASNYFESQSSKQYS